MPADDAVSPMQGDRYPTGTSANGCGSLRPRPGCGEAAASGRHGGAGTRQGQAFLLFRGVQPDPVDFLYSQTDGTGTPAAYHLFHLHGQHCGDSSEGGNGRAVVSAVPDRQPGAQHITQTVRLSGDHVPGLLPLPRASCEGGAAV